MFIQRFTQQKMRQKLNLLLWKPELRHLAKQKNTTVALLMKNI